MTVTCICSSKREPLGKGYVRGHKIPTGLGTQTPFGAAVHAKVCGSTTLKLHGNIVSIYGCSGQDPFAQLVFNAHSYCWHQVILDLRLLTIIGIIAS